MSVEELSERLDHRFALLTDGSRAALHGIAPCAR